VTAHQSPSMAGSSNFSAKNASEIGQYSKQAKTFYCSNHAAMWEMIDL